MAPIGTEGGVALTRRSAVPPVVRAALAWPGGTCYRHCDRPIRIRRLASSLPGTWIVRACPSGVVSVTSYSERTHGDPTPKVRNALRRWTRPPSLMKTSDLRIASRHGPELGPAAERALARGRPVRGVRVVYWRLYPFRARDGTERRLFVCWRRAHRSPVFFAASPASKAWNCPACSRRRAHSSGRGR